MLTYEEAIKQLKDLESYVFSQTGHLPDDEDKLAISVLIKALEKHLWIPCDERLPEESGKYLGQLSWGNITDITFSKKYQQWNAHDSAPPEHAMEVVAWMPLPEPYKVGEIDG